MVKLTWRRRLGVYAGLGTLAVAMLSVGAGTAAYATQSFLIDGSKSVGAIEWLGDGIWGYAFERGGNVTLALWNYASPSQEVLVPTGVSQVQVYDWMGNAQTQPCPGNAIKLSLGPEDRQWPR